MPKKFHVALSFADEDRVYVDALAKALQAEGVDVFYDTFETSPTRIVRSCGRIMSARVLRLGHSPKAANISCQPSLTRLSKCLVF